MRLDQIPQLDVDYDVSPSCWGTFANGVALKQWDVMGHTEVVKVLLEDGRADPRLGQSVALRCAATNGHTKIVELLVNHERKARDCAEQYELEPYGMVRDIFRVDGPEFVRDSMLDAPIIYAAKFG